MITNEDDCSAAPGVPLFDTGTNTNLASQLGPPANFRCGEFGHLCDSSTSTGIHPGRARQQHERDGQLHQLPVERFRGLSAQRSRYGEPAQGAQARPEPGSRRGDHRSADALHRDLAGADTADTSCGAASCPWPVIAHSCTAADTSFADPPVRISDLLGHFGNNGLRFSICGDIGAAMQGIADRIIALTTI